MTDPEAVQLEAPAAILEATVANCRSAISSRTRDSRPRIDGDDESPEPTPADQAWWVGNRLGYHATDAEPPAEHDDEARAAFRQGWAAGHDDFRAAMLEQEREIEERAERLGELDPWMHWSEAEIVRAVGCLRAAEGAPR